MVEFQINPITIINIYRSLPTLIRVLNFMKTFLHKISGDLQTKQLPTYYICLNALPSPVVDLVHLEPSLPSRSNKVSLSTWMVDQMDFLPEVSLRLLKVPGPERERRFRKGFNI